MRDGGWAGLMRDVARFALVGGIGLVVDVAVFNLLRSTLLADGHVTGAVLVAKMISTSAAILTNWAGNRWWTFRTHRHARMLPEAAAFFAVSLAGSAISLLCLVVTHYLLGHTSALADNLSANVVGLLLGSIFRFIAARSWVFGGPATSVG